jgi:hypothetical protein
MLLLYWTRVRGFLVQGAVKRRESIVSYSVGLVTDMKKGKLKLFCLPTSSRASRLDAQVIRGDAIRKFSKDLIISAH